MTGNSEGEDPELDGIREEVLKITLVREKALQQLEETLKALDLKGRALARVKEDLQYLARSGMAQGNMGGVEGAYWAGRRSVVYELQESGGLGEGRLGLEIVWLLPPEFVKFYSSLFHRALKVEGGDGSGTAMGRASKSKGGVDKAKGRTSMATEHNEKGGQGVRGPQAGSTGKQYRNAPLVIGSERAFKVKEALDKVLLDGVGMAKRALDKEKGGGSGGTGRGDGSDGAKVKQCEGKIGVDENGEGGVRCTRFLKTAWRFCPSCGTKV